jgi:LDH2 family malate/lactate/ureidoglycolate dehydrogenase
LTTLAWCNRPWSGPACSSRSHARSSIAADSAEVFYPGEIEARNDARHRTEGLLLPADTMADLKRIAGDCGIAYPFSV